MIEIKRVQTTDGHRVDLFLESPEERIIEAEKWMLFPALIDPHVHFRVPGDEHKETWETAAKAAIAGGVTTVFDMPNNTPPCVSQARLNEKKEQIDRQLRAVGIPLRYGLYLGMDQAHISEVGKVEGTVGLKIYMGTSTGGLVLNDREALEEVFLLAGKHHLLVAVHAEDEAILQRNQKRYSHETSAAIHSVIRSCEAATRAVELALHFAKKYRVRLYIAHVSCREELALIRAAKQEGLPVFAEVTPHHLFLHEEAYKNLGTRALVNPPLRTKEDCEALWEAIHDETIDTIGTDHAPHTLEEKLRPYGSSPSGFPSIEVYFALLLNAFHEKRISLEEIVSLTHTRPQEIFQWPLNDDVVLVDLEKTQRVEGAKLHSKAKWSPYDGWLLKGWPRYTVAMGKWFDVEKL